jgi:hypothetical protein
MCLLFDVRTYVAVKLTHTKDRCKQVMDRRDSSRCCCRSKSKTGAFLFSEVAFETAPNKQSTK